MTRKDYIQVANGCISAINTGTVKKKDIDKFIEIFCVAVWNTNFDQEKFTAYIKDRLW